MLIYKIFKADEWQELRSQKSTAGSEKDVEDGFVHFSTAEQAEETAAKHFSGESELMLVAVETDRLGDALKWEASRGGALFPHLYSELRLEHVRWAQPLMLQDGVHRLPPGLR